MAKQSKSKAKRKTSAWFQRHTNDPHVRRARKEGKRSRAAFKLTEIIDKYGLLRCQTSVVIDLGCVPGSWSAELVRYTGTHGLIISVDLLDMKPLEGVHFIQGDFTKADTLARMNDALAGQRVDMVVSDVAPEMSGQKMVDQARIISLNDMVLDFAVHRLREGGDLLLKSFMGEGFDAFRQGMGDCFASVKVVKPAASRKSSSEVYLLGQRFRR